MTILANLHLERLLTNLHLKKILSILIWNDLAFMTNIAVDF